MVLHQYAEDHGGNYPAGGHTPEASLSLLYPKYADASLLRGKTVPEKVVKAILAQGKRLGPKTCGWHYVEGFNLKDDPRLAIAWDKARLGHNGELKPRFGTNVLFVNLGSECIPEEKWDAFLKEQQALLAAREKKAGS